MSEFILYKKTSNVINFFKEWTQQITDNQKDQSFVDQPVFNKLFFEENWKDTLNYVLFPNKIYNARTWLWHQAKVDGEFENIKIFHSHDLNKPQILKLWAKVKHKIRKTFRK